MVLPVKKRVFDLFPVLPGFRGINIGQGLFQGFQLVYATFMVLLVPVTSPRYAMYHHAGVTARVYRLSAGGYHAGYAGCHAIYI